MKNAVSWIFKSFSDDTAITDATASAVVPIKHGSLNHFPDRETLEDQWHF